jgi:hypothetical protein
MKGQVEEAERLRGEAARPQETPTRATRDAAARPRESGPSINDVGTLLGVSHLRVHQAPHRPLVAPGGLSQAGEEVVLVVRGVGDPVEVPDEGLVGERALLGFLGHPQQEDVVSLTGVRLQRLALVLDVR